MMDKRSVLRRFWDRFYYGGLTKYDVLELIAYVLPEVIRFVVYYLLFKIIESI